MKRSTKPDKVVRLAYMAGDRVRLIRPSRYIGVGGETGVLLHHHRDDQAWLVRFDELCPPQGGGKARFEWYADTKDLVRVDDVMVEDSRDYLAAVTGG